MASDTDVDMPTQQADSATSTSNDGPTDDQHVWATTFCGIETRAASAGDTDRAAAVGESSDAAPTGNADAASSGNSDAAPGGPGDAAANANGDAASIGNNAATSDGGDAGNVAGTTASVAGDGSGGLLSTLAGAAGTVVDMAGNAVGAAGGVLASAVQDAPPGAGVEAVAAPAPAPPAPEPPSSPGVLEEIEEGVESGVRTVVKAAPAVLLTGPVLVAAAVGAAIMTWASDGDALGDGETNPETGKQFTSQEEWDAYKARQKQQQGGGGNCDGLFRSVTDQLKLLEQLVEEAGVDKQHLWEKEQKGQAGDDGTTWTGHKNAFEAQRTELGTRIASWEHQCPGMQLTPAQQEELDMAKDYVAEDKFPDKPAYAK